VAFRNVVGLSIPSSFQARRQFTVAYLRLLSLKHGRLITLGRRLGGFQDVNCEVEELLEIRKNLEIR
jgi:hypothetical protein